MKTHISSDPGLKLTPLGRRALIAAIVFGLALALAWALTDSAFAEPVAPAWHYEAAAQSNCAIDNTTANVGWLFRNTDTRTMRISVRALGQVQVRDVPAGSIDSGTFSAALPLAAGTVRFDLAWIWQTGTDSTTRSYAEVTGCGPTAITLNSFSAAPLPGLRDGCPVRHRWPGGTCTVSDSGVGWVSARCEGGFWFERQPTARTFNPDQVIRVWACIGEGLQLVSAPGYSLRIGW